MNFDFGNVGQPGSPDGPPVGDEPVEPSFIIPTTGDPKVDALNLQIAKITYSIDEITPQIESLAAEELAAQKEKEAFLVEVQKQLAKYDDREFLAIRNRQKIERQIREAEEQKEKLLNDISHHLEAQAAMEALDVAREAWQRIIDDHEWLWAKMAREYQHVGIQYIAAGLDRDLFGVGLLDEMGLGKTLQAVGAANLIANHDRFSEIMADRLAGWEEGAWNNSVLWLCPDSIKESTQKELKKWTDVPAIVVEGDKQMRNHLVNFAHSAGAIIIVGYAQMRNYLDEPVTAAVFDLEWPIVVMDEVHRAKNRDSSTFLNLEKLVDRAGYIIPMTGTPVDNKPAEFWTILHLLTMKGKRMGEFADFSKYERNYLGSWDGKFLPGSFDELMEGVSDMVIRRTKKDVLQDLPDKVRSLRVLQMKGKQAELYRQMREQMIVMLDEDNYVTAKNNVLAQITRLRQINLYPAGVKMLMPDGTEKTLDCQDSAKLDEAMSLIREMMEADEKVLIFSSFKEPLYRLQELIEAEKLTWTNAAGEVRPVESRAMTGDPKHAKMKSLSQDEFNDPNSDVRVVVGTIRAMGLGLNMQQSCSQCIFLDLEWNPGTNTQAEDRLHRQGQKNNVTIHILHTDDSVDNFIAMILDGKQGVFDEMFDRDSLRQALLDGLI